MMNKKAMIACGALCASCFVLGAGAAGVAQRIQAELRPDFKIVIDGTTRTFKNAQGETVSPILYNGSTYLPLRAIGELMGKTVNWDENTLTVTLSPKSGSTVTDADSFGGGGSGSAASALTEDAVKSLESRTQALADEISGLTRSSDRAKNRELYRTYHAKIEALEKEEDRLDDLDDDGPFENRLERVDDQLDKMDDQLERILGIDD